MAAARGIAHQQLLDIVSKHQPHLPRQQAALEELFHHGRHAVFGITSTALQPSNVVKRRAAERFLSRRVEAVRRSARSRQEASKDIATMLSGAAQQRRMDRLAEEQPEELRRLEAQIRADDKTRAKATAPRRRQVALLRREGGQQGPRGGRQGMGGEEEALLREELRLAFDIIDVDGSGAFL